ncbi:MAG TPA: tRNA lysidine(34) synthetase TilS [Burkholderiaceae bacterium]|nr:tRNA lysidine(34) synthetase TilS [Burkholderiaceae bacterium]
MAVGFSGGCDSTALLWAAVQGLGPDRVLAVHVNHGIAAEAGLWVEHAGSVAGRLGVALDVRVLQGLAAGQANLEERARALRRAALLAACKDAGIGVLLLAHHADDQAETLLLHLMRGTGPLGLGMPRRMQREGITLLRPLLDLRRADLEAALQALGESWIEDPSNRDTDLRRNAVRHRLWPLMQEVDARAASSLPRAAELAHEAQAALDWFADRLLDTQPDDATLRLADWERWPAAVQHTVFRRWLARAGARPPTRARLLAMIDQLSRGEADGPRCEHEGLVLSRRRGALHLVRSGPEA